MQPQRAAALLLSVSVVSFATACDGSPSRQPRSVVMEIAPRLTGAATVGDSEIIPAVDASIPSVLASAIDSTTGVRQLTISGRLTYSCYDGSSNGSTVKTVPIAESSTASAGKALPTQLHRQLDVAEESLRQRCGGNGAGSMLGQLRAEATFPDATDADKDVVERSSLLTFRYRTLAIRTFNIIGTDATAVAAGVPIFTDRVDAIAQMIAGYDVVALQEVTSPDQVETLAAKAGYAYKASIDLRGGRYDNRELAFLSRFPLRDVVGACAPWVGCVLYCPHHHAAVHAATIDVDSKYAVRIINTHFWDGGGQGNPSDEWRAEQAKFIQQEFLNPWNGRVVVVGDVNGNSDLVISGSLVDIADITTEKVPDPDGSSQTHCDDRIDVFFVRRPMAGLRYDGVGVGCSRKAELSDHPLVSAILSL